MERKTPICGICENANSPSVCAACMNRKLNEKYERINASKRVRDSLHKRLDDKLKSNSEAVDQQQWRLNHAEKIAELKETFRLRQNQLCQEKSELEEKTNELNTSKNMLAEAFADLKEKETKQLKVHLDLICTQKARLKTMQAELLQNQSVAIKKLLKNFPLGKKRNDGESRDKGYSGEYYYDTICNVPLPRGLDPNSVTPQELELSLCYMVQLLNLVVLVLDAPSLLDFGFAGSGLWIWQRASYSHSQMSQQQYPLFFPRQTNSTHAGKECSSAFDVMVKDVQKGIILLEKAVACVTNYCLNSFSIPLPTEISNFEAFGWILKFISSRDKDTATFLEETKLRCRRQGLLPESLDPGISSSSLLRSPLSIPLSPEISSFEAFEKILKFNFSRDKDAATFLQGTKLRRRRQGLLLESSDPGISSSSLLRSTLWIPLPTEIFEAFEKILKFIFSRDEDAATFLEGTKLRRRRQALLLESSDPGISSSSSLRSPLSIPLPTEIFEAFEKILKFISSIDRDAATFLEGTKLMHRRQGLLLESSDPGISSSRLQESESERCEDPLLMLVGTRDRPSRVTSTLLYSNEMPDMRRAKDDGRGVVEDLPLPPPPSNSEEDAANCSEDLQK